MNNSDYYSPMKQKFAKNGRQLKTNPFLIAE